MSEPTPPLSAGKHAPELRERKFIVARAQDVPEGQRLIVDIMGRSVGIFNIDGKFHAFLNRCPHKGAQLCRGDVVSSLSSSGPGDLSLDTSRKFLVCPWHGWEFDVETGGSWFDPSRTRARPFHVDVQSGGILTEDVDRGDTVGVDAQLSAYVDPVSHRIAGTYQAELLPVSVESDYIVLSLRREPPAGSAARH